MSSLQVHKLQKWALVTKEEMASPLDHDPTLPQYWSEHPPKRKGLWGKLQRLLQVHWFIYFPSHHHENTKYLATSHAIYSAALSTEAMATLCFFPPGIKGRPQVPTHCSTADSRTYVDFWAPYHQTNSNMQKYPSGTIYRRPFPNTLGKCISLPYGIPKAETASMLATKNG